MWESIQKIWMFDDPRSCGARALLRGAADGLREVGKDVSIYASEEGNPNDARSMREHLVKSQPDALFLGNHPSAMLFKQLGLHSPPCPVFIWLFDDPFIMGDEPFAKHDIVLAADPKFIDGAKARGAETALFLPVAAPTDIIAEPSSEYACPVAYVGSTMRIAGVRDSIGAEKADYLDLIIETKMNDPLRSFEELLRDHPIGEGKQVQWSGKLAYYLYIEANRRFRIRHLEPLADFSLKIYGNDLWKDELAGSALSACFCGGLDPVAEYPRLIRSASINLNLRSFQGFTSPTQRDFLMPMLGAFMLSTPTLSRYDVWETFDADHLFGIRDFPWSPEIDSIDAVEEIVMRYLNEPASMEEWTWLAKEKIEKRHTFTHRMEQLGKLYNQTLAMP